MFTDLLFLAAMRSFYLFEKAKRSEAHTRRRRGKKGTLASLSNPAQGRIRSGKAWVDWAETWGYKEDAFYLEWELVQINPKSAVTILTTIFVTCNQSATSHYKKYEKLGLDWIARLLMTNMLVEMMRKENIQVYIEDARPQFTKYVLRDSGSEREYDVLIRCRRMGMDNGKVQLVTVSDYLHQMGEYVRNISRRRTPEEAAGLAQIAASSYRR